MDNMNFPRYVWQKASWPLRLLSVIALISSMIIPYMEWLSCFLIKPPLLPAIIVAASAIICIWGVMITSGKGSAVWIIVWLCFFVVHADRLYLYIVNYNSHLLATTFYIILPLIQLYVSVKVYTISRNMHRDIGRNSKSSLLSALQFFFLAVFVAAVLCNMFSRTDSIGYQIKNINELRQRIKCLTIPQSAKLLHADDSTFQDTLIQAQLEIPTSSIGRFVDSMHGSVEISETDRMNITNNILSWWNPDSVRHFKAIRIEYKEELCIILISLDNPDTSVVYICYSED